ncbi:MAG TPA: hypothetical protein VGI75_07685 [Pirellulales bacterium]|jgi:hypothetical protein
MNTKKLALAAIVAVIAAVSISYQARTVAQDQTSSEALNKAKIKFAEALVKVAQADLAKAKDANAAAPEAVPSTVVRSLQNDVTMAQGRVNMLNDGGSGENPYVVSSKDALAAAQDTLKQSMEVNAKTPGTYSKAEVNRRQALVELAQARLAVCEQLAKASPEERMQWELLLLEEDVHNLRFSVQLLQYHN